jgi:cell division protein FtsW
MLRNKLQMNLQASKVFRGDQAIWLIVLLLGITSMLVVYSSTENLASRQDTNVEMVLVRHGLFMLIGVGVMIFSHLINYLKYAKLAPLLLALAIFLLLYTMAFGVHLNGAARWIRIPLTPFTIQTSDFAKVALMLYLARTISLMQNKAINKWELYGPVIAICVLIAPYDLSNALVLFATSILVMVIGKVDVTDILKVMGIGLAAFAILIFLSDYITEIRADTWISRFKNFVEDSEAEQVMLSKMAVARGGFIGVGPGNGVQSHFLPHAYSDYIYCIIVEEYGLAGGLFVLFLYVALVYRCIQMVRKSAKTFGAMLAVALSMGLAFQAFAHIAVNVNLVPATGLTLPFISLGGSSLLFTGLSFGIILSVSRGVDKTTLNKKMNTSNSLENQFTNRVDDTPEPYVS